MKQEETTIMINDTLATLLSITDEVLGELEFQFEETRNPEKLIGKPYETWEPQDFTMLSQIYGEEPNPLSELIFNKEYQRMKDLEAEELS